MAGPLHIFRRYQKTMIAIFGVLLMITFIITSNPNNLTDGGRRGGDPIVFKTGQGDVRENELARMMMARRQAHGFLQAAVERTVQNLIAERTMQIPPQQIYQVLLSNLMQDGIDVTRTVSEEAFVNSLIVARKAEAMGLTVSDEAINAFLTERTLSKVSTEQFNEIIKQMRVPQRELFDALRLELLSARLQRMVFGIDAVRGVTPGMRWDYFERLNARATAQTIAIPVSDFIAKVGEPDDGALRALYDEYKNNYALPGSPDPGFHQPPMARFDYFKADYEKFAATIEVSDADIEAYYEKNKEANFRYSGFTPPPVTAPAADAETPAATDAPAAETPATEAPVAETPAPETPAATEAPANESPATTDAPAATSQPEGNGGDNGGGAQDETPAAEAPATPPAADEPALVAPATTPAADEASQVEAATPPAADAVTTEPAAAAPPAAAPVSTVEPNEELLLPENILAGPNPDFEPLWSVRDTIRDTIRRERAAEKINEVFTRLGEAVDDYGNDRLEYEERRTAEGEQKAGDPPVAPDFAALGAASGVSFHSTEMLSVFTAGDVDLGKSFIGNQPFASVALAPSREWVPRKSADVDGNQFLFWKVESKPETVPTFDAARDEVLATWKKQRASELALKRAQEVADATNLAGKTLKELYGENKQLAVSETGEFSWMTESAARSPDFSPGMPEISEVPGVDQPGHEFMSAIFKQQPGQAAAALNAPHTVAYVTQVQGVAPAQVVLRERFMVAPYQMYANVAYNDEQRLQSEWMRQLVKEAGLDWLRTPDQPTR